MSEHGVLLFSWQIILIETLIITLTHRFHTFLWLYLFDWNYLMRGRTTGIFFARLTSSADTTVCRPDANNTSVTPTLHPHNPCHRRGWLFSISYSRLIFLWIIGSWWLLLTTGLYGTLMAWVCVSVMGLRCFHHSYVGADVREGRPCVPPMFISLLPPCVSVCVSVSRGRGAAIINLALADVFVFLTAGPWRG